MSEAVKAQWAIISIGALEVEGFMLPDGSDRMSQTQVAEGFNTSTQNVSNFLRSKAFKTLRSGESTDQKATSLRITLFGIKRLSSLSGRALYGLHSGINRD